MQAWEERYFEKQEGREEGRAEGRIEVMRHALENGVTKEQLRELMGATEEEIEKVCGKNM